MPDSESHSNQCLVNPTATHHHHPSHPSSRHLPPVLSQVYSSHGGPTSRQYAAQSGCLVLSTGCSTVSCGECVLDGGAKLNSTVHTARNEEAGVTSALLPAPVTFDPEKRRSSSSSNVSCGKGDQASKMATCRVLVVLLLVKCLLLSLIIPAHLIPTTSSEIPAPAEYPDNEIGLGVEPHHVTDEEGGQSVTAPEVEASHEHSSGNGGEPAPNGNGHTNGNNGDGGDDDDGDAATTAATEGAADSESTGESGTEAAATEGNGDGQASADEGSDATDSGPANGGGDTTPSGGNGGSCSHSGGDMQAVLDKIESLMEAVKNIDSSIDKMETLVQSTMIDERVYKCISAISNGNQTQAMKYWKQILRYLSTPQKQAAILNQLIRDAYGGNEEHIIPVIQFIEHTAHYYGYHTLAKELPKHNHLYKNTAIFTLGHFVKKSCGRGSALYKSLPGAVQSIFADFFTLQNKHNKGYLYYAKRCVAKHYHHCLDVLTKRIDPYVLDGLDADSEEKKRYHWKLNATDSTVTQFFILNHDKYWTYRLQDLNNSPRFKMEEAGSNAEVEQAHFKLKLHTDDEIMIQVRDSDDYLEEEDFKSDKAEVRLHSFHQSDGIPNSPRMFWLVSPVNTAVSTDTVVESDHCNIDLASVPAANGNGNGGSK